MTSNIDTQTGAKEKFIANRNDLLVDATIAGVFSLLTGTAAIMQGTPLAAFAAIATGLTSISKTRDLYKLVQDRKQQKYSQYNQ